MEPKAVDIDLDINFEPTNGIEKQFIDKVKELDIVEIEPLLEEDSLVFYSLEKYQFLVMLRNLFLEFKRMGDTQILVDKGSCEGNNCTRASKNVYQFKGNNSNQTIFFGVQEENGNIKFHGCMSFVDQFGVKGENYQKLTWFAVKALQKLEKGIQESSDE